MTVSAKRMIWSAVILALWVSISTASGKDDLVAGMERNAGIRFTDKLKGDYNNADTLNAVITDVDKFKKLGISTTNVKMGDIITVELLDKNASKIAIIDTKRHISKSFSVGDFGKLTPVKGSIAGPAVAPQLQPPVKGEFSPLVKPPGGPAGAPLPAPPTRAPLSPLQGR